ncbi:MAG: hypothetical protein ACTTJC_02960 [Campylobacter sp.]
MGVLDNANQLRKEYSQIYEDFKYAYLKRFLISDDETNNFQKFCEAFDELF